MVHRIRKGDTVVVISGADAGKRGRVLRVLPKKDRVVVEGARVVYKHMRKSQKHPNGARIRKEASMHISNVMPIDPETNQGTRVASKVVDGARVRVGRRSGAVISDSAAMKE